MLPIKITGILFTEKNSLWIKQDVEGTQTGSIYNGMMLFPDASSWYPLSTKP